MPEPQPCAVVFDHPSPDGIGQHDGQVHGGTAGDRGQVGEREPGSQDGGEPQRYQRGLGQEANRIGEDAQHQCALASCTVGNESECHAADPGGQQREAVEQTSRALAHTQVAHDVRQHERVEHGVKGIEHPAQSGSNQSASLRRSTLGECGGDARSHSQDCRLFAQDWQQRNWVSSAGVPPAVARASCPRRWGSNQLAPAVLNQ